MSNITEYPVFEADQVLRSDHLNNMFNYLDDQNRLTRRNLIGIGIVCGLDVSYDKETITVSKGLGVTSLGYLIQFDGGNYNHARVYTLPDDTQPDEHAFYSNFKMWKLFSPDTDNPLATGDKALTDNGFLEDKVVILFLEWRIVDLKNCTTADCDDKGKKAEFTIRPLLVSAKDLATFKYTGFVSGKANLPDIVLKRFNVPFKQLKSSTDILNAFYAVTDVTTLKNIADGYSKAYDTYKPVLTGESSDPFSNLFTTLTNQLTIVKNQKPVFTEYFYDWLDDFIKAYNEFRKKGDSLLVECAPDGDLFPFHLALGEATWDTRTGTSIYRNYFIHSPVFGSQKSLAGEVQMLFNKMKLLVGHFVLPDVKTLSNELIKVTPSSFGRNYLSNRAIPYYYNTSTLLKYWSYEKTSMGKESKNLSYHSNAYSTDDKVTNPLKYELEPYNFFRIEGHLGKHTDAALANIVKQKQNFNLPFDVIALNVANAGTRSTDIGKCNFADLESQYNVMLAELLCKIHEPVCFLSKLPYINLQSATGLFNSTGSTGAQPAGMGTGANPGAETERKNEFNIQSLSLSAGFTNVTDFQNLIRSSATKVTFNTNANKFYVLNENFIDQQKNIKPYHKGTFLKHFCSPATAAAGKPKTVGQVYLETITSNAAAFPKPINLDTSGGVNFNVLLNYVYSHIFYFIDTAEDMFATLLPKYLYNLDYPAFEYRYKLLTQEAQDFAQLVLLILAFSENQNQENETKLQDFFEDVIIDLVVDEMEMITHLCMDERIKQLYDEYLKRLKQLNLERMFAYYTMQHSGLDHKAGVPAGGTFILVYQAKAARTDIARNSTIPVQPEDAEEITVTVAGANEKMFGAAPAAKESDINASSKEGEFTDVSKVFELNKEKLTEEEYANALALIGKIQTNNSRFVDTFNIGENIVFADFYLPYMCCSDCAPVSYIIQDKEEPPVDQTTIKLSRNIICSNETDPLTISVSPKGGTLSFVKASQLNDTTYQVAVADLPVGDTTITYTANGQPGSDKVTVFSAPDASFTNEQIPSKPGAMQFTSNTGDTALVHDWNFGDPNSGANTSTFPNPVHEYKVDTSSDFNVTHSVSSKDGCKTTVTQKITVKNIQPASIKFSKNTFCSNDTDTLTITVAPAGGSLSLSTAQQINDTTYQVAVTSLIVGDTTITYSANGQNVFDKVTVSAAPNAGFSNSAIPSKPGAVQFKSDSNITADKHQWNFGDASTSPDNTSTDPNPVHEYHFTGASKNFDVSHTVTGQNGCISKQVNTISVKGTPQEISETRVYCFNPTLPVEDPATVKSAKLLNEGDLKPVFDKSGISLDDKMQLHLTVAITETIHFILKYTLDNSSDVVTKNVDVTIIGVNTAFNLKLDTPNKNIVFTPLATSPEKVHWDIMINSQQSIVSNNNIFTVPVDNFANMEKMVVTLTLSEVEKGQECKSDNKATITRDQYNKAIRATGGANF